MTALYDRIGRSYVATRSEDPRIAAAIHAALGDARANISVFALLPAAEVDAMVAGLDADLRSGAWARRNADLLARDEYDFGYRILVAE